MGDKRQKLNGVENQPTIYRYDVMVAYMTLTHDIVVQVHLAVPLTILYNTKQCRCMRDKSITKLSELYGDAKYVVQGFIYIVHR